MRQVLYVDDEPALCKAFERALRGTNVHVVTTTNAHEAIELVEVGRFDVVASDLRMPGLDGLHVLRAVKDRDPCTCRLLVSGEAEPGARGDAFDEVVCKPWGLDELRDVIRRAADQATIARQMLALERLFAHRTREAREALRRVLRAHAHAFAERCSDLEWDALMVEVRDRF